MKPLKSLSAALIASLLLPSPLFASMYTSASSYMQPKYTSGAATIHSACMMPAEAKLSKAGLKRHEDASSESATVSDMLHAVFATHLKRAGVAVSEPAADSDAQTQQLVALQQKFDDLFPQIRKHPKDIQKSAFTLGPIAQSPCAEGSDVLAFAKAEGRIITPNHAAVATILHSGPTDSTADIYLALVDARSGEVAGLFHSGHVYILDTIYEPERTYGHYMDKEFQKMKLGSGQNPVP